MGFEVVMKADTDNDEEDEHNGRVDVWMWNMRCEARSEP
jgi:hypothetical protein